MNAITRQNALNAIGTAAEHAAQAAASGGQHPDAKRLEALAKEAA